MKKHYLTLLVVLALNTWCSAQTTWGASGTRTDYRDDAGLQGNAGAISGFYQTPNPVNFPNGASSWWHLLDVRHSEPTNNYAMQFSGSFFDQNLYFRKTNNSATRAWSKVLLETDGKVGIGTTAPSTSLEVMPTAYNVAAGVFHLNGGQAWGHVLTLATDNTGGADDARLLFSYRNNAKNWALGGLNNTTRFSVWEDSGDGTHGSGFGTERLSIIAGGNVGIGTALPDAKLAVKGTIHAQEVKVDLNVPGPDYVFDKAYSLRPLSKLKNYITNNRHLPEIASAETMERDGINVTELNMTMLKKIEELTLYLLEKDVAMKKQAQRIERLEQLASKSSLETNRSKNRPAR